jgi:hypothetical protein
MRRAKVVARGVVCSYNPLYGLSESGLTSYDSIDRPISKRFLHRPFHPKFDMQSFDMQTVEAWR